MKTKNLLIFLLILTSLSACKKYEEGPSFTLLTPTKRIIGTWNLNEMVLNDSAINIKDIPKFLGSNIDSDSSNINIDFNNVTINKIHLIFEKEKIGYFEFSISYLFYPFNISEKTIWDFDEEKDNVSITMKEETQKFRIVKLTSKEMWLEKTETTDNKTDIILTKFSKVTK